MKQNLNAREQVVSIMLRNLQLADLMRRPLSPTCIPAWFYGSWVALRDGLMAGEVRS